MKSKIELFVDRLQQAVRLHPVEVLLSIAFSLVGCIHCESGFSYDFVEVPLAYFPVLFLITYTLNGWTAQHKFRFLYYLSAFFFIPFLWMEKEKFWTSTYLVSLVVAQLLYLVSGWKRDNDAFMYVGLRYLRSLFSAGLLAGIAYLLAISIYASVQYIFEIWQLSDGTFYAEAAFLIFMCGMPLLFLMFIQDKGGEESPNRLFEVLLNYVLSPALLIYAVILYLYFIKIAVLWSLPKGEIAYIVVSFVSATFILKGCQAFLTKRYYDWFYRFAGLAVLPALVMYWIGTCYRINQYGFTEARVYLVVTGWILTALALLFFSKRWGRYLYASVVAIVSLSAVTYVPGITAKDIERISQTGRGNYPRKEAIYDYQPYFEIDGHSSIDISGYKTLETVNGFRNDNTMWSMTDRDSLYIFNKGTDDPFYAVDIPTFWTNQLAKAGLNAGDSIPQEAFPILLEFDMDSAKLVFQSISLYRSSPDSMYRISYVTPGYYLKKQ